MANDDTNNAPSGPELVRSLAELSRVGMTEDEIKSFGGQLDAIIESVSALQEVDTEGVEPTGHAIDVTNVYREDSDRESYGRDEMLSNAPAAQEGYVRVRYVFGEDETEPYPPPRHSRAGGNLNLGTQPNFVPPTNESPLPQGEG